MTGNRCKVLGYNVDLLTFNEAINFVLNKISNNEWLHIVTINPEIIAAADKNKELEKIIKSSELVLPESSGIKKALNFKGIKQEQIPGIDFAKELIHRCADLKYSIALIGAKEHVITKTIENLKKEYPALNIVYSHNGYYENENIIIDKLAETAPRLILCALGAPKQEIFINNCKNKIESGIFIGIGGSFDVWAGEVKRAPKIFQKTGLEWLYRTIKQPSRIKRIYKTLPMFLFRAIMESARK